MKKRFGNAAFTGTLSQGLYPAITELDTLAHTFGFAFEFQDGIIILDTVTAALPSVQSASLVQVIQYINREVTDTIASALPTVLSASLVSVITYEDREFEDTAATALPTVQSASLTEVVRIQELYDHILDRPEDTLQHTNSWEFTFT